ncbi:orotidine 5'-phosphate decarboxylase / HUMPS family protein [Thermoproteus tenax]|uniref:Orotidine 5'-phosphate decarboxylase n=1 Tax=Thermoproteus tenax (strain ATCC 35583 / DSM 2078 / JCM 9277 / NBRC 100435 / Kra 1) TaxID=768679 RepID=G4RPF9_THETK|nr:orotidine 5'-phosphate decarboxylase / HUMPS family protein [Thermoproteus tenax]CCC81454.1 orotidine-5'-phosphate decarboxylase [Thermoproteus tenax Kra 1]
MRPVIVALDTDLKRALSIAEQLREEVAGFKIGWDLVLEAGLDPIRRISKLGQVIVDLKLADIPYVVNRVVNKVVEAGACCAIAHGLIAPSLEPDQRIYLLVRMTTPTLYDDLWRQLVPTAGKFRGAVAPGNAPSTVAEVRKVLGCSARIISPGIGAQGGKPGDAIRAGADFEIVGRYLIEEPSRISQWDKLKPTCWNSI